MVFLSLEVGGSEVEVHFPGNINRFLQGPTDVEDGFQLVMVKSTNNVYQ